MNVEEFTAEARAFLDGHATPKPDLAEEFRWGVGDDFVGIVEEGHPETEAAAVAAARQ